MTSISDNNSNVNGNINGNIDSKSLQNQSPKIAKASGVPKLLNDHCKQIIKNINNMFNSSKLSKLSTSPAVANQLSVRNKSNNRFNKHN